MLNGEPSGFMRSMRLPSGEYTCMPSLFVPSQTFPSGPAATSLTSTPAKAASSSGTDVLPSRATETTPGV